MATNLPIPSYGVTFNSDASGLAEFTLTFTVNKNNLAEALSVGRGLFEELGYRESGRSGGSRPKDSGLIDVHVTYSGQDPNKDGTDPDEPEDWEMDYEESQEPLETHPRLQEIMDKYGGYFDAEQRVKFPQILPGSTVGAAVVVGLAKEEGAGDANPVFGQEFFFRTGAVARKRVTVKSLPDDFNKFSGKIVERPDIRDLAGQDFGSANWLTRPVKANRRGAAIVLQYEWLMSDEKGWPEEIYEFIDP